MPHDWDVVEPNDAEGLGCAICGRDLRRGTAKCRARPCPFAACTACVHGFSDCPMCKATGQFDDDVEADLRIDQLRAESGRLQCGVCNIVVARADVDSAPPCAVPQAHGLETSIVDECQMADLLLAAIDGSDELQRQQILGPLLGKLTVIAACDAARVAPDILREIVPEFRGDKKVFKYQEYFDAVDQERVVDAVQEVGVHCPGFVLWLTKLRLLTGGNGQHSVWYCPMISLARHQLGILPLGTLRKRQRTSAAGA